MRLISKARNSPYDFHDKKFVHVVTLEELEARYNWCARQGCLWPQESCPVPSHSTQVHQDGVEEYNWSTLQLR